MELLTKDKDWYDGDEADQEQCQDDDKYQQDSRRLHCTQPVAENLRQRQSKPLTG